MLPSRVLRVLVVAGDPLARAGLVALIENLPECVIAGQSAVDERLPDDVELYQPDIIVLDLGSDPSQTIERIGDITGIETPILVLISDESATAVVSTRRFNGVLPRDVKSRVLLAALKAIEQGLTVADPQLTDILLSRGSMIDQPAEPLTPRELEILQLLAEGIPNKSIALRLGISDHTVKFHVNSILGKLGVQNRTEAVSRGARLGLIKL